MKKMMSKESADIILGSEQKYKLKSNVKGNPTAIRLAKIAASFPRVSLYIKTSHDDTSIPTPVLIEECSRVFIETGYTDFVFSRSFMGEKGGEKQ